METTGKPAIIIGKPAIKIIGKRFVHLIATGTFFRVPIENILKLPSMKKLF